MKIAIPHIDGKVNECFEESNTLRIYEIQSRVVHSTYDIEQSCSDGNILADKLVSESIDGIICGNINEDTCEALIAKNIAIYSGADGETDQAIKQLLDGDVVDTSGAVPGMGVLIMEGKNAGKVVSVHYTGTFNDGTVFDSSYDRNEPLEFACGYGLMIAGFEKAVIDMEVGDKVDIHLEPSEAYGDYNPAAIVTYPLSSLPGLDNLQIGQQVSSSVMGQTTIMTVIARDDESITFDSNHEMAGKELNFAIELLSIK